MTAIIALSLFGISNLFWGFWFPRKVLQILTLLFLAVGIGLTAMDYCGLAICLGQQIPPLILV